MIELLDKYDITEDDLEGAMKGLVLLLSTYRFNITEFVNGKIRIPQAQVIDRGVRNPVIEDTPMIIEDIEILSKIAYNQKYFDLAVEIGKFVVINLKSGR